MYSSCRSRDCSGGPRCIFHQSDLPSFTVVDLVRTVFAVPGVCKMTTETCLILFVSARCLVRQWLQIHELVHGRVGKNSHIFFVKTWSRILGLILGVLR